MHARLSGALLVMASAACSPAADAAECGALPSWESVVEADARDRGSVAYDDQELLRNFVLYAYRNLADDIVDGNGPYLDTLRAAVAGSGCSDSAAVTRWSRTLLLASPSVPDFARRIAATAHRMASPAKK